MEGNVKVVYGCPSIFSMLFITFLVLKLTNVINWSWWWVTAPLWGPVAVGVLLILLVAIIGAVCVFFSDHHKGIY